MIKYLKNWLPFFQKTDLPVDIMIKLYEYLTNFSPGSLIAFDDINFIINDEKKTKETLKLLNDCNLLQNDFKCPECKVELEFPFNLFSNIFTCPSCETDIPYKRIPAFKITENASNKNFIIKKYEEESYELNAELLSKIGAEQNFLIYVLFDIVKSQIIQKENNDYYNEILHYLWHKLFPNVLLYCNKAYLPLYANGDAIAFIFSSLEDILILIEHVYNYIKEKEDLKLRLFINKIIYEPEYKQYFIRNLYKKWDFNIPEVTDFYRIVDCINIDRKEKEIKENDLNIYFINDIIEDLKNYQYPINDELEYDKIFKIYGCKDKYGNEYNLKYLFFSK